LRIRIPEGCTKGQASDLLGKRFAAKKNRRGRPKSKVS